MRSLSQTHRSWIVIACLLAAAAYLPRVTQAEPVPIRETLGVLPLTIAGWNGGDTTPLDAKTVAVLGVDEYLNRVYLNDHQRPVGLYIAYYASQRQGDTMHSPLNCLPGSGWSPVHFNRVTIPMTTAPETGASRAPSPPALEVNRYVIEKGLDRQLVLYWYQSHGRVVASEYWGKFYLVLDAIRMNRTDGALVRLVAPLVTTEDAAEHDAVNFARALYPMLGRYLPS
jgi:EpsI family protein